MIGKKSIIAVIPARLKSKRLAKKNIKILGGKPLICWTIDQAKKSKYIDEIIVSTESRKIAKIAENNGINIPFLRPSNLASDKISPVKACLHLLKKIKKKYDYILVLQPTSPLRKSKNIDDAIKFIYKKKNKSVISIYCSKLNKKHQIYLTKKNFLTKNKKRRKNTKKNFYLNGAIYIARTNFFIKKGNFFTKVTKPFFMSEKISHDIDSLADFMKVKKILKK